MPRYNDYFRSHMFPGDPRTPLTAAGACTWPTVPAHRYLLTTTDADGILAPLNSQGILMEKDTVGVAHDFCTWNMISAPAPIMFAFMYKTTETGGMSWKWELAIAATVCGIMTKNLLGHTGKCNVDFPIGNMSCPGYYGNTGASFRAAQVVFDESAPPTYP